MGWRIELVRGILLREVSLLSSRNSPWVTPALSALRQSRGTLLLLALSYLRYFYHAMSLGLPNRSTDGLRPPSRVGRVSFLLRGNHEHEYTKALISSVPKLEEKTGRLAQIEGQPPMLWDLSEGDAFAPRSTLKFKPEDAKIRPELVEVSPNHWVQLSRSSVKDFDKFSHLVDY